MPAPLNGPESPSDRTDYITALEILQEVSEHAVAALSREAILQAEVALILNDTGTPMGVVEEAEAATFRTGVILPREVAQDVRAHQIFGAEIAETGEDLSPEEAADLDESVADEADLILFEDAFRRATAQAQMKLQKNFYETPISQIGLNTVVSKENFVINLQKPLKLSSSEHLKYNLPPQKWYIKSKNQSENLNKFID